MPSSQSIFIPAVLIRAAFLVKSEKAGRAVGRVACW
jgi:hypothetical protein